MYGWVAASLFAIMSVWADIGTSLAALLSELSCVVFKEKKISLSTNIGQITTLSALVWSLDCSTRMT